MLTKWTLSLFVFLTAGCASIVSKSSWPVIIDSSPPGATIKVTDDSGRVVHTGVAPCALTLSSREGFFTKADYEIEAELPGHAVAHSRMSSKMNAWYMGNILFGGLIGWLIVDPATGAMWKLGDHHTISLTAAEPAG